jgi:hypothetical protein
MITQIAKNSGARRPIVGDDVVISISASALCQRSTAQAPAAMAKSRPKMTFR